MEFCQFRHGVGLLHETFHTDRRKESNHGCICTLCCHMLRRAAEGPTQPGKTDNHHRHGADDYTPHPWFNPLRYLHELLLLVRRDVRSAASSFACIFYLCTVSTCPMFAPMSFDPSSLQTVSPLLNEIT